MNNKKRFKSKNKSFKIFFKKRISRILYFLGRNKKATYIAITLLLIVLVTPIVLSFTFFTPQNTITNINFDKDNINTFDEGTLYNDIKNGIFGKNYYLFVLLDFSKFEKNIKIKYPMVKKINIGKNESGEINIKLDFNNPSLIFNLGDRVVAVLSGEFFDLSRSSSFLSGAFLVTLPDYLGDLDEFNGFFYKVDEVTLKSQMTKIMDSIGIQNISQIIYYPGAVRTSVILNDKRKIYFNNGKDISQQLQSYEILKVKYQDFSKLLEVDLGGIQTIIIKKLPDEEQNTKK